MAECGLETITVTGAALAGVNGVYTKTAANQYQKTGYFLSYASGGSNGSGWYIFTVPGFIFSYYAAQDPADCPTGLTFVGINAQAGNSFVLGDSSPSQPTFGLPTATVALITSRFGSVANFLRLRNQGQV